MKRFLVKHVGNMGDLVFFVPPIVETIKKKYPDCHITLVTAWGLKNRKKNWLASRSSVSEDWGQRNQGGFCISLMMTNPHVDQLVHFHETKTSLDGSVCIEEGVSFPTWSRAYYEKQKISGEYDEVFELDIGVLADENPMKHLYSHINMPEASYTDYKLYVTQRDKEVAASVMENFPHPRIVLLEGMEGRTTRGWDPEKISVLEKRIEKTYGTSPLWFGAKFAHEYEGRPLTLRENIATLIFCDVAIGVLSGPLHFAAAIGLPTITMMCDQPVYRAAPAYFLNSYIKEKKKLHRTLLGPTGPVIGFLKEGTTKINLTPAEWKNQNYDNWMNPGKQATKSCLSVITPDEVMTVLSDIVHT